ncbi:hypothetical protein G6F70_001763 [Rhizopus microsporus]|nr:hypothetical protein G6F71_002377 [Rhizopus microsporus]KAG1203020.1 hypothetical protein G6F70_001763 [Rhizopus microsporus]KAG1216230.1 hypothetical protein G6F69_000284 [Rhizopus microsporus]KAG1235786.1 hypothetical protein G6F67_002502 [Rhizopus microsporus]
MNKAKTKPLKPKDTVEKTFVIKTSLANTCKYPKLVTLIQEVADHITQLVYAGSFFANYYFLQLLENGEELPLVTQNLFYNIYSTFAGQGKHASDSIKQSFKIFCESTSLTQSDLNKYASKGYMVIVSSMAKQYETLVRNYRKSLAKHIFQRNINPKSSWPSTVDRIERYETIVNNFLTFWSMYDASNNADVLNEADLNGTKKFIQEMKHQDKASSGYVHRKLQELPSDIDAVQTFIKTVQAKIRDKTFMPLKCIDPRGSRYFSLLPLYKIDPKSIQIDAQSFWKLVKQCDNKIKPGYKTLDSLTSRSKKFADVITTDGYALSFIFKKTVSIQDEPKREPKTPKDFVDIVDDAGIWDVDPSISTIFTAVDSTEYERVQTTSFELPTLKTANLASFLLSASTRLQNYQRIHNYYCQDKWSQKSKFKAYINKQKGTQEIVKRLFDNSKKLWNRNVNSALNTYGVSVYKLKHDNENPPFFKRTTMLLGLMRCP